MQAIAKQNECKILSSKVCGTRELADKVHEHEAHKRELLAEEIKVKRQFEILEKRHGSEQSKIENLQNQVFTKQKVLDDLTANMDMDSDTINYASKLEDAKSTNENLKTKLNEMKDDLAKKRGFDSTLKKEMQRKHQERVKPLETRLFAKKDELAGKNFKISGTLIWITLSTFSEITAKLNVYQARPTSSLSGSQSSTKMTPVNKARISAKSPCTNSDDARFSPANVGVNKFFKGARTPTYGTKRVSFTEEAAKRSGGAKRGPKSILSTQGTKRLKPSSTEPKTPRTSKKLFNSSSGYNVFDESP